MAKSFSMASIAGMGVSESVEAGLLNIASQAKAVTLKRTEYIPIDLIHENEENDRSMNDIEELACLIRSGGMDQSLVAIQLEDGTYKLLTGHRRLRAIKLLMERGQWEHGDLVEIKIKDLSEIKLPLDDKLKEKYARLQTNRHRRETDSDKAKDIFEWREIIGELRKQGVEFLISGIDDEHQEMHKIKGVQTKEIVSELVGESTPQVSKYFRVQNNGSEFLKQALLDDTINISVAEQLTSMPKEEQDKVITHVIEKKQDDTPISKNDIRIAKKELSIDNQNKSKMATLTKEIFMQDIEDILTALNSSEEITLTENKYATYLRGIENLKKTICKDNL